MFVMTPETRLAHAACFFAQLGFSGFHVVAALVLVSDVDPLGFALWREFMACCFMLAVAMGTYRSNQDLQSIRCPQRRDWLVFIIIGCCSCCNVVGSLFALSLLRPTQFAVMQPLQPIIAFVFNSRQEILTWQRGLGVLLAVAGAVSVQLPHLLNSTNDEEGGGDVTLGFVIASVQVMSMATLVSLQKPLLQIDCYESATFTLIYYFIGALFTLVFVARQEMEPGVGSQLSPWSLSVSVWLGVTYAAIFATTLPFNFFSFAGKHLPASTITLYVALQPLLTAVLSVVVLDAKVTFEDLVGALLVVVGLALTLHQS